MSAAPRMHAVALVSLMLLLPGLPLAGAWLVAGRPEYALVFPPRPHAPDHPDFSAPALIAVALLVLACIAPFIRLLWRGGAGQSPPVARPGLPWWGWLGIAVIAAGWWLAWTRYQWFAPLQRYTFVPLWFGFVLVVNALCVARGGGSPMTRDTGSWLVLFPVSAVFWWVFEYMNLHTLNWYYVNTQTLGTLPYVLHASASFATVLPAVTGTAAVLASIPRLSRGLDRAPPMPWLAGPRAAWWSTAAGGVGLALLPLAPRITFPLLWLAPMLLAYGVAWFSGARSLHARLARGDLSAAWISALAALVCGIFWEGWNWGSFAAWRYEVPWVDRFHLFEMPLAGYAGYLPFGIVCVLVAELAGAWKAGEPGRSLARP